MIDINPIQDAEISELEQSSAVDTDEKDFSDDDLKGLEIDTDQGMESRPQRSLASITLGQITRELKLKRPVLKMDTKPEEPIIQSNEEIDSEEIHLVSQDVIDESDEFEDEKKEKSYDKLLEILDPFIEPILPEALGEPVNSMIEVQSKAHDEFSLKTSDKKEKYSLDEYENIQQTTSELFESKDINIDRSSDHGVEKLDDDLISTEVLDKSTDSDPISFLDAMISSPTDEKTVLQNHAENIQEVHESKLHDVSDRVLSDVQNTGHQEILETYQRIAAMYK